MALVEIAYQPSPSPARLLSVIRAWLAARRTERAQRIALNALLEMPEHRLRDLGIERRQLVAAGPLPPRYWPTRK